jgi:hypothetical protein
MFDENWKKPQVGRVHRARQNLSLYIFSEPEGVKNGKFALKSHLKNE